MTLNLKKTSCLVCLAFVFNFTQAQNVIIPDNNFLHALIAAGIDTSGDSIIQNSEALSISQLSVGNLSISNLTGIEAFANLTNLDCGSNQLTAINLTNNTKLISLGCQINTISTIDVSKNTLLEYFDCGGNYTLASLDLSKNTHLKNLDIIFTGLSSIDLSHNLLLEGLSCSGTLYMSYTLNNSLRSLDVSKNTLLNYLSAGMNPQLNRICVNSNQLANKVASWSKDSTCVWDTVCAPPPPPASPPPIIPVKPTTPAPIEPVTPITSVTEIEKPNISVEIIRCFDSLGKEIDANENNFKGIIIYQYSDGSTKKVMKID